MKPSSRRFRRVLWLGGAAATAVATIVAGVTTSVAAQPASLAGTTARGPGYPPPKGIYAPFTNCPLMNPIMHEMGQLSATNTFGGYTACTAGLAGGGSITIGNITTTVTEPVNVQFGFTWQPDNAGFPQPVYPPLAGESALLSTKPDLIPEPLTTALSCSTATDPTIQNICNQAAANPADNQVFALAEEAGALTNFNLFSWTQPVKFQLINPLLGSNCFIGSDSDPVVLHPQLMATSGTTLTFQADPQPTAHPDTFVIALNDVNAGDTTFSAPGVLGCGPGGLADVPVDLALNASSGLPAASGVNSLTLNGNFSIAANFGPENFPQALPQPQDAAANLLAAFKASTNGEHSVKHLISMSKMKSLLHFSG